MPADHEYMVPAESPYPRDVVIAAPNAAVDSYYVLSHLQPGEVHRSSEVWHTAGGKGNNTARALLALGGRPLSLGIVGGRSGEFIRDELAREGIACELLWSDTATRQTCTMAVREQRQTTVVLEAGRPVGAATQDAFTDKLLACAAQAPFVLLSGSLPPGFPADYYAQLIERLRGRPQKVCVDTSGETLRLAAEAVGRILKVNVHELRSAFGGKGLWNWDDARAMFQRLARLGLELLAVTDGPRGAYVLANDCKPFQVMTHVESWVSTAGAGDTFGAALLLALGRGEALEPAARFASAAAAASLRHAASGVLTRQDVQRLLECTEIQCPA